MGETRVFIPYLLQICACTRISFGLHLAQDALPLLTKKKKKDRLNLFMLERKKKKMGGTGLETEWKYSSTTIHTYMAGNDYTCLTSLEPRQVGDSLRSPLSFLFFLLNSTTQVFLHTNPPPLRACMSALLHWGRFRWPSSVLLMVFYALPAISEKKRKQITTITKNKSMKNLKIMAIMIVIIIATVP